MFKEFCHFFEVNEINSSDSEQKDYTKDLKKIALGYNELLDTYQGTTFGNGLYRLHRYDNISIWNEIVLEAFPEFKNRIDCFGYDWLGRQFSLDKLNIVNGQAQILMFEPGTGEVLEIPCNFMQFHEEEIRYYHDACLASETFNKWLIINKEKLNEKECIGYKNLLFLGGSDTIDNLEKSDLDVYWSICAELIKKTKELPEGTKINIKYL